jgi:hypothetical protein
MSRLPQKRIELKVKLLIAENGNRSVPRRFCDLGWAVEIF